jgi:dipeptidyl aminopeptidase/acylaminoacyl peptidase
MKLNRTSVGALPNPRLQRTTLRAAAEPPSRSTDMRKRCLHLIVVVALATTHAQVAAAAGSSSDDQVVLFRSDDGSLWTGTLNSGALTDLVRQKHPEGEVSDLALSPGGNAVAYTRYDDVSHNRSVEIADLVTGKITKLSAIPTPTSSAPNWSSDGRRLAVNTYDGKKWNVALMGPDNNDYRALDTASKADRCMDPSWAPSGQWLCCMSRGLWRIGTDGNAVQVLAVADKIPKVLWSIPRTCSVSADGDTVIFETELEDDEITWHDGGRPVLFAVKASGEGARRVGPNQFLAHEPRFVDEHRFLFLGFPLSRRNRSLLAKDRMPSTNLYLGSLDNSDAVLLRTRVREFSIAKRRVRPSNPASNPTGLRPAG